MTDQLKFSETELLKPSLKIAFAALIFALLAMASSAILIKFIEAEITPVATAFHRFWITTVVLVLWNGFSRLRRLVAGDNPIIAKKSYPGWVWGFLVAAGLFFGGNLILWAWSLTQTSVANSTLLANLTPLFTTLGAWLIWGKRFDSRFLVGMSIAMAGAIAIGLEDFSYTISKIQGDIAATLAALLFALYLLVLEKLQTELDATTIVFWSSAIATLLTLPLILISPDHILPTTWQGWLVVIALAVICQILGQGLMVYSLNVLSSGFIALFLLLEPVLAAIGAGAFFSETLGLGNWLAFAVVLVGMYLALSSPSAISDQIEI